MITSELGLTQTETFTVNNSFLTVSQSKIFMRRITPKNCGEIKATLLIVHGFGEHSGLFLNVAQHFLEHKYQVLMVDLKGFGYSGAGREVTTIPDMEECVIAVIGQADINKPLILFGHSMGGLVCTNLAIDYHKLNISALILQAPFLGFPIDRELPWHKKLIVELAGTRILSATINSMISLTSVSKNPHQLLRLLRDPLVYPFLNFPLIRSFILSHQKSHKYAHLIKTPYLILHGVKDQITPIRDSVKIISHIASKHKKLVKFQEGYHELHHDQQQQEFYNQIHSWLSQIQHEFQPLGIVSKSKRSLSHHRRYTKLKAFIVMYFIIVLKLITTPQFRNSGIIEKILSPILYVINLIKGQ